MLTFGGLLFLAGAVLLCLWAGMRLFGRRKALWRWGLVSLGVGLMLILVVETQDEAATRSTQPRQPTVEEIKAAATTPRYDDSARNPDNYKGKPVVYKGEVLQAVDSSLRPALRVAVNEDE